MDIRKDKIKNILVVRRNNIGDMICAIPMLRTLRKEFPAAHITVLADKSNAGIIKGASFIDDLLVYEKEGSRANKYLGYYRTLEQKKRVFDLVITAKAGFSSLLAFISLASGAGIRMGCVPDKWHPMQICYNLPVKNCRRWKSLHQVDGLLEFIKTIGIKNTVKDINIEIAQSSRDMVSDFFQKNAITGSDNIVVFNVSNNKPENTWPIERFRETAGILSDHYKITFLIASASSDKDGAVRLSEETGLRSFYFESPGVMDFAALAAASDLLICGEGGAMHIGSGVNTPTVSLWSTLRPVKWTPRGEKQLVIKKGGHVTSISAEDVLEVIKNNNLLK
ncbi:MAG TPA: lipopolysaccharide heptosyltransferase family protein [Nitrospirae bacterium]|nr:lipopolysaccharide core biosynthesis protein [bacterium BMS3Abin10]GBE39244.1 lipopolysaccharide core biosynthesis protein [bacterium BMS3Bbin08]HDH50785.1 lipopolysaccharide heptosyltransferase family protein [Nitrospirota bacterium]HDK82428.1 lipopolysaccharide heptosyltransferase family protein [Nitrospirota bacterium]HDO25012.1 lipopolysaccharide heptosyltransferase family protein [Nitrospirota bacterium]